MRKELKRTLDEHIETATRAYAYKFDTHVYPNANNPHFWGINLKAYRKGMPNEVWTGGKWLGANFTEKAVKEAAKYFKAAEPLQLYWKSWTGKYHGTTWSAELRLEKVVGEIKLFLSRANVYEVGLYYNMPDGEYSLSGGADKNIRAANPRKAMKMAEKLLKDFIEKDAEKHRLAGERIARNANTVRCLSYKIN